MKIMVSACLLGENCKYNGGNNLSEKVMKFIEGHEVIPVCPEVMGNLPTPRTPSEIVNGVVLASPDTLVHYFETKEALIKALKEACKEGDTILVKASHFMNFPEIVKAL